MTKRRTTWDEICINNQNDGHDTIRVRKCIDTLSIWVTGLGINGYLRNFIRVIANKYTSIHVKEDNETTVYLTVHHNKSNAVSIRTDYNDYPGLIKSKEFIVDLDKLIEFISTNGTKVECSDD